jgi:ABC-type polysaccharide/polyol phosphate export permease
MGALEAGGDASPLKRYRVPFTPRHDLVDFWHHRELARSLTERDLRVRYKQSWFGWAWPLITPMVTIVLFSIFFKHIGHINTGRIPYPLFSYVGLLPWSFFSGGFSGGSGALLTNSAIVNKVYCPREVFVVESLLNSAFDTALSAFGLAVLYGYFGYGPEATMVWIVPLIAITVAYTAGMALAFSTFVIYIRDVRNIISVIISAGMFLTPVAWPLNAVPKAWRGPYCVADPLAAVIDGFRRCALAGQAPRWNLVALAGASSLIVLVGGYLVFRRLEGGIADVA